MYNKLEKSLKTYKKCLYAYLYFFICRNDTYDLCSGVSLPKIKAKSENIICVV